MSSGCARARPARPGRSAARPRRRASADARESDRHTSGCSRQAHDEPRRYHALAPRDRITLEQINRHGLDALAPDSSLNVNSRAATLAHYAVQYRGRSSLQPPDAPRYAAATARDAAVERRGDAPRKPPRADVPLDSFRPQRRNFTLAFTSPGDYLPNHARHAAAAFGMPLTIVGGGDGGVDETRLCGLGDDDALCAGGCPRQDVRAFVQNALKTSACASPVRPLGQGVKHSAWEKVLRRRGAEAVSRNRTRPLLCAFMAAHPGRVEKLAAPTRAVRNVDVGLLPREGLFFR